MILCYHGVSLADEHVWNPELFVSPQFLASRFELLKRGGFNVLPLAEAAQRLRAGSLPERSVVITFDDGFYDFQAAALPVIESHGFPTTVYLSTYFCVNQRPISGLCIDYLLWKSRDRPLPEGLVPASMASLDMGVKLERRRVVRHLLEEVSSRFVDNRQQTQWIEQLSQRLAIDWPAFMKQRLLHLMTETEVADVARRGVDVQLHTHRHRTPRDAASFKREIVENRDIIQSITGMQPRHFCYPSGVVEPSFLPWLRESAVDTATTCETRLAQADDDPLLLPRFVDTLAQPQIAFEGWLSGLSQFMARGGTAPH